MTRKSQLSDRASVVGMLAILFIFVGLVLLTPYLFHDARAVIGSMVIGTIPPEVSLLLVLIGLGLARLVKRMEETAEENQS